MSTVAVTRTIDASPARVWALLTNLRGRTSWSSSVDQVEVVSGGPFGPGTVWRETHTLAGGSPVTEEFQVSECQVPHLLVIRSPGSGADYRLTYRLVPVDVGRQRGGTAVTVEQVGHPNGATGRVLELVLGGLAARTAEGALRQELVDLSAAAADRTGSTGRTAA